MKTTKTPGVQAPVLGGGQSKVGGDPPAQPKVGGDPPAGKPAAQTGQADKIAPEGEVLGKAQRVGVKRYTKVGATGGPLVRDDLAAAEAKITRFAELAIAYAKAGKHDIAAKRLGQAKDGVEGLAAKAEPVQMDQGGLHHGMWSGDQAAAADAKGALGRASKLVEDAAATVQSLSGVKPVSDGKTEQLKTTMLFGLSANPPTHLGGHAGIVEWGATKLKVDVPNDEDPARARENVPIDEVWVLPVYKHMFASKSDLLGFDDRHAMARLAFEDLPGLEGRVQVKDTERQVITAAVEEAQKNGDPPESVKIGSIDMIRHLMKEHPDRQFVLSLGGDTYRDLLAGKWKEGDTLQELIPIVVIPRKGVDGIEGSEDNAPDLTDISSTKVRGSTDLEFLAEVLHPDVLQYVRDHKLYAFAKQTEE